MDTQRGFYGYRYGHSKVTGILLCVLASVVLASCESMRANRLEHIEPRFSYGPMQYAFFETDANKVLVANLTGKDQHLYLLDLQDQSVRQITSGNAYNFDMAIAPDDSLLAYATLRGRKRQDPRLRILDLNSLQEVEAALDDINAWHPLLHDGKLFFTSNLNRKYVRRGAHLFVYDLASRELTKLTDTRNYDVAFGVDAEANRLHFQHGKDYSFGSIMGTFRWRSFCFYALDMAPPYPIEKVCTQHHYISDYYRTRLSHDAKYALQYNRRVYLMNLETGVMEQVLPLKGILDYEVGFAGSPKVRYPTFHPQNDAVIFAMAGEHKGSGMHHSDAMTIHSFDYAQNTLSQIGDFTKSHIEKPVLSNDGSKLLFRTRRHGGVGFMGIASAIFYDLWLYDIEEDDLIQLSTSAEFHFPSE